MTVPAYSVVTATTLDTEPERFPTEDGSGDYIQTAARAVLDTDATGKKLIPPMTTSTPITSTIRRRKSTTLWTAAMSPATCWTPTAHGSWRTAA